MKVDLLTLELVLLMTWICTMPRAQSRRATSPCADCHFNWQVCAEMFAEASGFHAWPLNFFKFI